MRRHAGAFWSRSYAESQDGNNVGPGLREFLAGQVVESHKPMQAPPLNRNSGTMRFQMCIRMTKQKPYCSHMIGAPILCRDAGRQSSDKDVRK